MSYTHSSIELKKIQDVEIPKHQLIHCVATRRNSTSRMLRCICEKKKNPPNFSHQLQILHWHLLMVTNGLKWQNFFTIKRLALQQWNNKKNLDIFPLNYLFDSASDIIPSAQILIFCMIKRSKDSKLFRLVSTLQVLKVSMWNWFKQW